jgi:hypothetical protein
MAEHESDTKTESRDKKNRSSEGTDQPRLDWGQADVKEGKLTVSVAGEPPDGWKDTFEKTAALLSSGDWDTVRMKKLTVRVEGVRPGTEDKLRHFLESVVQQANATHEPEDDHDDDDDDGGKGNEQQPDEAGKDDPDDAGMTERFRSFANPD